MKILLTLTVTGLLILAGGCTDSEEKTSEQKKGATLESVQELKATMSSKLDTLDSKINELEAKVESQSGKVKGKLQERLGSVKEMRKEIAEDLETASEQTQDSFAELRIKVMQKYEVLSKNLEKALKGSS